MKTRKIVLNVADGWVEAKVGEIEAKEISNSGNYCFEFQKSDEGLPVEDSVNDCGHPLQPSKGANVTSTFDSGDRFYLRATVDGSIAIITG